MVEWALGLEEECVEEGRSRSGVEGEMCDERIMRKEVADAT